MVTQRAMGALAIVEAFDVIEDLAARLGAGGEVAAVNEFQFEGAPEAFHGGVVVAVAFAAHGGQQAGLVQRATVIAAGALGKSFKVRQRMRSPRMARISPTLCALRVAMSSVSGDDGAFIQTRAIVQPSAALSASVLQGVRRDPAGHGRNAA